MRGENEDVGIRAQCSYTGFGDPTREINFVKDTKVLREPAIFIDRTVSGECCAPGPRRHWQTGEGSQELRHALSRTEIAEKKQMAGFAEMAHSCEISHRIGDRSEDHTS